MDNSKEQLKELISQIENAQIESDEYHKHSHHHRHHHGRRGSRHTARNNDVHHSLETTSKQLDEAEIEAILNGTSEQDIEITQNKIKNTKRRIRSGNSFAQTSRRRRRRARRILLSIICTILILLGGAAGTGYYMIRRGEKLLQEEHVGNAAPDLRSLDRLNGNALYTAAHMNTDSSADHSGTTYNAADYNTPHDNTPHDSTPDYDTSDYDTADYDTPDYDDADYDTADYDLIYEDQKYKYNDEILNFLIVGIDTKGEIEESYGSHGNGKGQSDTLILGVMDNQKKTFTLIPINRDTITSIEIYDQNGNFLQNSREQIALSFAYGDGKAFSAELTEKAVSNLFYGLPIHGYVMVNIDAITLVNDMMGGVEVTLEEDYTEVFGPGYEKGKTISLYGEKAEHFVRTRKGIGEGNNAARMNQQKQYLAALIQKALKETRANLSFPVDVYNVLTHYMITDLTSSKVAYLASRGVSFNIEDDFYRSIKGESVTGDVYEEFYVDEVAFYEMMLDVFYNKVY